MRAIADEGRIRLGDVGTKLRITMMTEEDEALDISEAESLKIIIAKPGGTKIEDEDPTLETDGGDGKMYYVTQDGDVDEMGRWRIQGYAKFSDTQGWHSTVEDFTVAGNL